MKAYKLKFHSSFHIDSGTVVDGPSETFIHSDTLFSALVSAARKFYGVDVALKFLQPNAMILSSTFPFYKNELFLPKPLHFYPENLDEYEMIKVFKKAKFVSKDHLLKILNNQNVDAKYFSNDYILDGCWRTVKSITSKNKKEDEDEDKIFRVQEVPHIVMDRITNQTQIFYKSEVYFNENAGLYFIAEVQNDLLQKFETVLRFLGDEGLGADRTIGKGFFEIEKVIDFSLSTSQPDSNYYYLLSLYSPTKEEFENIDPKHSYYDFIVRGGWVSNNTLNRKNLRMFVEGSVLYLKSKKKLIGNIHKVLEKAAYPNDLLTDIYRSGQALFLPFYGGINDNN